MEKKIKCPLCESDATIKLESIKKQDIVQLYAKYYKYDVNADIKTDFSHYECVSCGIRFFDPVYAGGGKYYSFLSQMDWYYLHEDKTELEYALGYINPGMRVLDVGSGRGVFGRRLEEYNVEYVGIELNPRAVSDAQKEGLNVLETSIEEHVGNRAEYYDVVVCFQVLEHIENIHSFVTSCLGSLKKDGIFIVAVPNNDSFIKYSINNLLNIPPHHVLQWNEKSMLSLGDMYEVEVVDICKERVTSVHRRASIVSKIRKFLFLRPRQVDTSLLGSITAKMVSLAYRLCRNFLDTSLEDGQTIIAAYRKK